jgi:hypothetical protein
MVPDRCVDSDGSSTEEWPSPTSSDNETHSADTHRAPLTSQPLPKRPRSAQAQVHVTNPTKKRKRHSEVSIRKPQRPHKQHQSQPSHTAQQEPQVPFQRRSIEDIITHIHETRSHLLAQRSNPTFRNPHDKVSRRGIRRVRSGPRDLGGTSDDDTEDSRPRIMPTSHTQSYTPSEPQRAALTPPPRPQSGRLGVGHQRIRPTPIHTQTRVTLSTQTTTQQSTTITQRDSLATQHKPL